MARQISGAPEGSPDLPNGLINPVFDVNKNVLALQPFGNLRSRDHLPAALRQEDQQVHRPPLKPRGAKIPASGNRWRGPFAAPTFVYVPPAARMPCRRACGPI